MQMSVIDGSALQWLIYFFFINNTWRLAWLSSYIIDFFHFSIPLLYSFCFTLYSYICVYFFFFSFFNTGQLAWYPLYSIVFLYLYSSSLFILPYPIFVYLCVFFFSIIYVICIFPSCVFLLRISSFLENYLRFFSISLYSFNFVFFFSFLRILRSSVILAFIPYQVYWFSLSLYRLFPLLSISLLCSSEEIILRIITEKKSIIPVILVSFPFFYYHYYQ